MAGEEKKKMAKVGSCHVQIIVKSFTKYKHIHSDEVARCFLSKCCKDILIYSRLTDKSVIDLSNNKLANLFGIKHIIVKQINIQHKSEKGVVSKSTKFFISSVHSEDYYKFSIEAQNICKCGGLDSEMAKVLQIVHLNRLKTHVLHRPLGIIVHGPSGCGKTLFAKNIAVKSGAILMKLNMSNVLKSEVGAGPESLKNIFEKAVELIAECPVILFFDDISMLCPRPENTTIGNKQLASAFMSEMDSLQRNNISGLFIMGNTTSISLIDPLLRRPGRFDQEVISCN